MCERSLSATTVNRARCRPAAPSRCTRSTGSAIIWTSTQRPRSPSRRSTTSISESGSTSRGSRSLTQERLLPSHLLASSVRSAHRFGLLPFFIKVVFIKVSLRLLHCEIECRSTITTEFIFECVGFFPVNGH